MYGKTAASGLTELIPFICISAIWGQILFPCSPEGVADGCILHSRRPSTSAISVGVEAFGGLQFGELSFTFGGQKSLMAVTFLVYWYDRRYFHFTVSLHGYKSDHILETFHEPFFWSHYTGRHIPDQGKVTDKSLQVLISGLGPLINNKKFSGSSVF